MMLFGPPNFANGNPGPFPCGGGPCIPVDQGVVFLRRSLYSCRPRSSIFNMRRHVFRDLFIIL
jgi:hypothetical protein